MNGNGLTWNRWLAAALFGVSEERRPILGGAVYDEMRSDWCNDVDPTDWAADLGR